MRSPSGQQPLRGSGIRELRSEAPHRRFLILVLISPKPAVSSVRSAVQVTEGWQRFMKNPRVLNPAWCDMRMNTRPLNFRWCRRWPPCCFRHEWIAFDPPSVMQWGTGYRKCAGHQPSTWKEEAASLPGALVRYCGTHTRPCISNLSMKSVHTHCVQGEKLS